MGTEAWRGEGGRTEGARFDVVRVNIVPGVAKGPSFLPLQETSFFEVLVFLLNGKSTRTGFENETTLSGHRGVPFASLVHQMRGGAAFFQEESGASFTVHSAADHRSNGELHRFRHPLGFRTRRSDGRGASEMSPVRLGQHEG